MNSRKLFKYNIARELGLLPKKWSVKKIEEILKERYGISATTFYRDRNIRLYDKKSIPSDRLDVYAALFDTTVEQLKNYKIQGTTLSELGKEEDDGV